MRDKSWLPALAAVSLVLIILSGCGGSSVQTGTSTPTGTIPGTSAVGGIICGEDIDLSGTDYIANGTFLGNPGGGVPGNWKQFDNSTAGTDLVTVRNDATCGNVVQFTRNGSNNASGSFGLQQDMNTDVSGLTRLKLQMVLRIDEQLLLSDGTNGGETPVFVTIDYMTANGESKSWSHGLQMTGPVNYPDRDQVISPTYWYTYNLDNLLPLIPDAKTITSVAVGGSGWDLDSKVAYVSLRGS